MKTKVSACLIVLALAPWLGSVSVAETIAPKKTARVAVVSDKIVSEVLDLGLAQPILVGESRGQAVVALLTLEPEDVPRLRSELFSADAPGCKAVGGPETCCGTDGSLRISTELGWVNVGQRCEPASYTIRQQGMSEPGPLGIVPVAEVDTAVAFVDISHDLSAALYEQAGIDYQLSQVFGSDGEPRVLVSPIEQRAERRNDAIVPVETMLAQIGFSSAPERTVAWHPVTQAECTGSFNVCMDISTNQKCRRSNGHIYLRNDGGRWCRLATCCSGNCNC